MDGQDLCGIEAHGPVESWDDEFDFDDDDDASTSAPTATLHKISSTDLHDDGDRTFRDGDGALASRRGLKGAPLGFESSGKDDVSFSLSDDDDVVSAKDEEKDGGIDGDHDADQQLRQQDVAEDEEDEQEDEDWDADFGFFADEGGGNGDAGGRERLGADALLTGKRRTGAAVHGDNDDDEDIFGGMTDDEKKNDEGKDLCLSEEEEDEDWDREMGLQPSLGSLLRGGRGGGEGSLSTTSSSSTSAAMMDNRLGGDDKSAGSGGRRVGADSGGPSSSSSSRTDVLVNGANSSRRTTILQDARQAEKDSFATHLAMLRSLVKDTEEAGGMVEARSRSCFYVPKRYRLLEAAGGSGSGGLSTWTRVVKYPIATAPLSLLPSYGFPRRSGIVMETWLKNIALNKMSMVALAGLADTEAFYQASLIVLEQLQVTLSREGEGNNLQHHGRRGSSLSTTATDESQNGNLKPGPGKGGDAGMTSSLKEQNELVRQLSSREVQRQAVRRGDRYYQPHHRLKRKENNVTFLSQADDVDERKLAGMTERAHTRACAHTCSERQCSEVDAVFTLLSKRFESSRGRYQKARSRTFAPRRENKASTAGKMNSGESGSVNHNVSSFVVSIPFSFPSSSTPPPFFVSSLSRNSFLFYLSCVPLIHLSFPSHLFHLSSPCHL